MSHCTCDYHQEQNKKSEWDVSGRGIQWTGDDFFKAKEMAMKNGEEKKDWLKEFDKELSGDVDWTIGAAHEEYCVTSDNCNCLTLYDRLNDLIRKKLKEEQEKWRLKNAGLYRQLFAEMNDSKTFTAKELWKIFDDYTPLFTEEQKKELKDNLNSIMKKQPD